MNDETKVGFFQQYKPGFYPTDTNKIRLEAAECPRKKTYYHF